MAQRTPAPELPGYTFRKWLGGGGFADVFHYHQEGLGRDVAIKMLHHGVNPKTLAAFQTEASLMAKLSSHPNIVTIFEMDIASDGRPYLVMEMCPAAHLGERVSRRLYSPAKAMEVGVQIAGAVETAHRLGVLHRDIKPANILFTQFSVPALTDFGISISVDQGATASTAMSRCGRRPSSSATLRWVSGRGVTCTRWPPASGRRWSGTAPCTFKARAMTFYTSTPGCAACQRPHGTGGCAR